MKQIIIEDAQTGISDGGFSCGPVGGHAVAEARIRDENGKSAFYGLVEFEGMAYFYAVDQSRYETEITERYPEGDEFPEAEAYEYGEFFDVFPTLEKEDPAHALLLKYLVCLVRLDRDDAEALKKNSIGKAVGSFALPVCDKEEEYLEDQEVIRPEAFDPGPGPVYALETVWNGEHRLRYACPDRDAVLERAAIEWGGLNRRGRASYSVFRVVRTVRHWSDIIGPVYGEPEETVMDFLEEARP